MTQSHVDGMNQAHHTALLLKMQRWSQSAAGKMGACRVAPVAAWAAVSVGFAWLG